MMASSLICCRRLAADLTVAISYRLHRGSTYFFVCSGFSNRFLFLLFFTDEVDRTPAEHIFIILSYTISKDEVLLE